MQAEDSGKHMFGMNLYYRDLCIMVSYIAFTFKTKLFEIIQLDEFHALALDGG